MKTLITLAFSAILVCFMTNNSFALIYTVDVDQDADAAYSTQWPGAPQSNQGASPEIGGGRANDGYDSRSIAYLGFDLFSNNDLKDAILQGARIDSYKFYSYNVTNFSMGDSVIGDVITNIHYVNNDNWWEGPYLNWTVINSSNPMDGITWNNQVGYNEWLATESEDDANRWYAWELPSDAFALGGINDNPNYFSLAMVPNSLNKSSSWWLVSRFASKENLLNPHPYLEVHTTPVPEPATVSLIGLGLLGFVFKRRK